MTISYRNPTIKGTNVRFFKGVKQKTLYFCLFVFWKLFPKQLNAVLPYLFFRPPAYFLSERQKQLQKKAKTFNFESGGKRLRAYEWGEGPAVVLLHGWGGCGLQFDRFIPVLINAGFSVLAFDQAAHGESGGKTANYFEFSNAVDQFFNQIKNRDVIALIGHSLGASAAINHLWRSRQEPEIILISPALYLHEMLKSTFERYGIPKVVSRSLISDIGSKTGHDIEKENPAGLLKHIHKEILIVHDTKDTAVPYSDSWNAGLGQNNIRLFPTTGLGHYRILQDNALVEYIAGKLLQKVR